MHKNDMCGLTAFGISLVFGSVGFFGLYGGPLNAETSVVYALGVFLGSISMWTLTTWIRE